MVNTSVRFRKRRSVLKSALIVGFGYIGQRLAEREIARGSRVSALVRSDESAVLARSRDVEPRHGDLDTPLEAAVVSAKSAIVYYLAPPPPQGDADSRMAHFLAALDPSEPPEAIVYISTTGVYGDTGGDWVDESSPLSASQSRGKRRIDAERKLTSWNAAVPATRCVVLRVGGIYGPDRLPVARLQRGEPMLDDPTFPSFVNVIHADDLVTVCMAAADRGKSGQVFNVASGQPVRMIDYFRRIAQHANLPAPRPVNMVQAEQELSAGMLSYVKESRRVDTRRLREVLGVELAYEDLDRGIAASLQESTGKNQAIQ